MGGRCRLLDREVGRDVLVGERLGVRLGLAAGLAVGAGVAVRFPVGAAAQAQFFEQLRRHLRRVLALGVAAAAHELPAAALADDHRLAALLAVDVRRDRAGLAVGAGGRQHGVLAQDLGDHVLGLGGAFLQEREQRLDLLELVALELAGVLHPAALGEVGAAEPRAALAVAEPQLAGAALLAGDRRLDRRRLGGQELALLVEVDDRLALGVAGAAEEFAEAAAP